MSNRKGSYYENRYADLKGGRKISRLGYPGPDVELGIEHVVEGLVLAEVKYRAHLPTWLEEWQDEVYRKGADYLAFKRARGDWWVMMPDRRVTPRGGS